MQRIELSEGVVRVTLTVDEAAGFAPIPFVDETGEYLRQVGFACEERPVYRLKGHAGGAVKRTANGEVVVFDEGEREFIRMSHSAALTFVCPEGSVLTGLGQHEDGAFDYSRAEERLYQHNMKIAIPFLLSSAGWGLLIEAGCAMRYRGTGDGFTFLLDAADAISYVVIRGRDCAEVLKKLSTLVGRPALLPKWAYGYIQSKERYTCADELLDVTREFRRRKLGLDCIVLDWMSWNEGCWGDKTPDPSRFPDVKALTDALHGMDARFMVSVWPNCGQGRDCEEFEAAGLFLPGSQIYDAFNGEAREMYWSQCRRYWMDGSADALWCDSCEHERLRRSTSPRPVRALEKGLSRQAARAALTQRRHRLQQPGRDPLVRRRGRPVGGAGKAGRRGHQGVPERALLVDAGHRRVLRGPKGALVLAG